jgi:hypothetical protein
MMPYVSTDYANNKLAPKDQWICSPGSTLGPYKDVPPKDTQGGYNYCGQCVSYVRTVCPTMPATGAWTKGKPVKGNQDILPGTAIATFNEFGKYYGHAAIYVSQNVQEGGGITVYDQWVALPGPKAVGPRTLRWGAIGMVNNGDNFYVVE